MSNSYSYTRLAPARVSAPAKPVRPSGSKLAAVLWEGQDQFAVVRRVPVAAALLGIVAALNLASVVIAYAQG